MSPNFNCASAAKTLTFRHFPQLDGLRGAAILLVIAGHVLEFGLGAHRGGSFGGFGVMVFFVLSGFLITGLLSRELLQTEHIGLSQFYIRRVFRLFPALFCFLAVLSLLIKLHIVTDTPWYTVVSCLIYTRNLWGRGSSSGHIWSLSIEEQFYLLWPWVMSALTRRAALWTAWAGVIIISTFRMTAIYLKPFDYAAGIFYERSWFRFDSILIGCAIALWLFRSEPSTWIQAHFSRLTYPVLLWPAALAWTLYGESLTHAWYLTVQMILATLILLNLLLTKNSFYLSVFSHPAAGWCGRISYSWYLWQQFFTASHTPTWFGLRAVPLNVAISLVIAMLSYRFIERPCLRMREHLASPSRSGSAPAAIGPCARTP